MIENRICKSHLHVKLKYEFKKKYKVVFIILRPGGKVTLVMEYSTNNNYSNT